MKTKNDKMASLMDCIRSFKNDETGQSTTEYILILSVVVMIALKFKTTFSTQLNKIIGTVSTQIDSAVDNPAQ